MRRREFITLLGGAAAWPLATRAQQPERMRRIGVVLGIAEDDPGAQGRVAAFQQGLAALGWSEGRNIRIDYRFGAGEAGRIQTYVSELVSLVPDLIVANSTPVVAAFKKATSTIPVVVAVVNDPVGQGFIASLSRPGGNITGFTFIDFEMIGKWTDLLAELSPPVTSAGLIFGSTTSPYYLSYLRAFEVERGTRAVTGMPVRDAAEIEPAVASLARTAGSGLIAPADAFNVVHRKAMIAAAARHSVPAIYTYRQFVVNAPAMRARLTLLFRPSRSNGPARCSSAPIPISTVSAHW